MLLYRPARLHRLAESIPCNRFLGTLKVLKSRLCAGWPTMYCILISDMEETDWGRACGEKNISVMFVYLIVTLSQGDIYAFEIFLVENREHLLNQESILTLQRQFRLYIPFLGIARPQPQFPHSCVCERFIYFQDRSTYFLQQKRQTHRGNI